MGFLLYLKSPVNSSANAPASKAMDQAGMDPSVGVLIVDEHVILRELLAAYVNQADGFHAIAATGTETDFLSLAGNGDTSIALVASCTDQSMTVELVPSCGTCRPNRSAWC